MSKDIPLNVGLLTLATLSTGMWNRLKDLVAMNRLVFTDEAKKTKEGKVGKKPSKTSVVTTLNKIDDEKKRQFIINTLERKDRLDDSTEKKIVTVLEESNIIRESNRGKQLEEARIKALEDARIRKEEADKQAEEVKRLSREQEDIRLQLSSIPTTEQLSVVPTAEQLSAVPTIQQLSILPSAEQVSRLATAEQVSRLATAEQVQELRSDIKVSSDQLLEYFNRMPQFKTVKDKLDKKLKSVKRNASRSTYEGLGLDRKVIQGIIDTIPEENKGILGDAILSINAETINYNTLLSGLVGLAGATIINPMAGAVIQSLTNQILNRYKINIRDYISSPVEDDEQKERINELVSGPILSLDGKKISDFDSKSESFTEGEAMAISDFEKQVEDEIRRIDEESKLTIKEKLKRRLELLYDRYKNRVIKPTSRQITQGVSTGAMASAITAGLTTGSAMGAVSGLVPGGIAGGLAGAVAPTVAQVTAPMVEQFFRNAGVEVTDDLKRKINWVSLIAPPALVGAYLGYTPQGEEVMGKGIVSGAGITERKLIASPEVIQQTKVQETQITGTNKMWQPKSISPTTDILDTSQQEKYADDVEMIAQFDYIPPGTEGANGDLTTNLLKRSQATADGIRYTDAGVYIPYMLWNKINDTDTLTPTRLDKLALGPELPPMDFMAQDNEDTFENVAEFQFANAENTSIEFLSPYANFSNVDNYWEINPNSMLYTINA